MDKELLVLLEKQGYIVQQGDEISQIELCYKDNENNKLDKNIALPKVFFMDTINKREIIIGDNSVLIVVGDNLSIVANDFDYQKNNRHICYNRTISLSKYDICFMINRNGMTGLSSIYIDICKKSEGKSTLKKAIRINLGYGVAILNIDDTYWYYLDAIHCTTDEFIFRIMKNILDYDDFKQNVELKRGFSIIRPSLELIIDKILDIWYKHLDEYIRYLNDMEENLDSIYELTGGATAYSVKRAVQKAKKMRQNRLKQGK